MSVFLTRQQRLGGFLRRSQSRGIVSNPALNTNPAFRNPAIVPFGIEFVDDGLRKELDEADAGLADEVETLYYRQCQEDAELNSARLPRTYESPLWGFIYGQRLVSAQTQLDTLDDDERFMSNYLRETIDELTMRMNRFYPALDYGAQVAAAKAELAQKEDPAYTACYNAALRQVIVEDPQRFVAIFKNNAFLSDADCAASEDDKFGDFLPERVEGELTGHFQYAWDANSALTDNFSAYFARISRLEAVVAPKVDSLSKNLRANFAGFLLRCFEQGQLQHVDFVVELVRSAAPSVIGDEVEGLAKDEVARKSLALLEEMSSAPPLLSKLFFGDAQVDAQLAGKSKEELVALLQNVDETRLVLINRALQVYDYLKYHSMTRLLLTCLIKAQSEYFGQFLNAFSGDANIEQFESANNSVLDEAVSSLSLFYEAQEDVSKALEALMKGVESQAGAVSVDYSAFAAPPCFVVGALEASRAAAEERGDLLGRIRYLTLSKYVAANSGDMSGLALLVFLMNPARNGIDGDSLKRVAFQFATNASGATDELLSQVVGAMQQRAQLEASGASAFKSSLAASLDSELTQLRGACADFDSARTKLETALQGLQLNFGGINFDHAKSNYDPLSTYLAQFRYYNNR